MLIDPEIFLRTLKKIFYKGDLKMEDLQPVKTKEQLITEIFTKEDLIEEAIPKIGIFLNKVPEAWLPSINKNYETFLAYCLCITDKYNKEVKPLEIES